MLSNPYPYATIDVAFASSKWYKTLKKFRASLNQILEIS